MSIKIGHASLDEEKKTSGGNAGDQTGGEVCTRSWYYDPKKPWDVVLRPKTASLAEKSAKACEAGCANNKIGYDQRQRNTLYTQAKANGFNLSKITTACECDCSSFVHVCAIAGGANLSYGSNGLVTWNMADAFVASGNYDKLTQSKYLNSDSYLKRGDILIKSGHVVMVLENGSKADSAVKLERYGVYYTNIDHIGYIPMSGSRGETVSSAAVRKTWNGRCPDVICNAELFNRDYSPASGVVANGEVQLMVENFGVAFADGLRPILSYKNNVNAKDWLGVYPLLVRNKERAFEKTPTGLTGNRGRTCLAWNDTQVAICFVREENGCTLEELADAVIAAGFHTAINFDGGGSTAVVSPFVKYDQGRKVRGKIGIWTKDGTGNLLAKNAATKENSAPKKENTTVKAETTSTKNEIVKSSPKGLKFDKSSSNGVRYTVNVSKKSVLNLRDDANGNIIGKLSRGTVVWYYGWYKDDWYYVQVADGDCAGYTGMVSKSYLKKA